MKPKRTLGKRAHSITSPMSKLRYDYEESRSSDNLSKPDRGLPSASFPFPGETVKQDDFVRENKIRIVEKLGSMKTVLLGEDNATPTAFLSPSTFHSLMRGDSGTMGELSHGDGNSSSVEWLDDTQLSTLSNGELESLMDRYIMAVVKELVQLAAVDDDLKAEMDSLDGNGYSLFHYCCLYNLTSLIPVLIARGVDINQTTASGSTALHLAVAAGHIAVAQLLLESGVDAIKIDSEGMTAYDIASTMGQDDISRLLYPVSAYCFCCFPRRSN